MQITGTRRIPAKPWFGALEKDPKPIKFDFTEILKVMKAWGTK